MKFEIYADSGGNSEAARRTMIHRRLKAWVSRRRVLGIALVSAGALAAGCGGGSDFKVGDCTDHAFQEGSPAPKKLDCGDSQASTKVQSIVDSDGRSTVKCRDDAAEAVKDPSADGKQLCLYAKDPSARTRGGQID